MDRHLFSAVILPATVESVAPLYPFFRKERERFASFARAPPYVWALRQAQQGYFFHADLQATLCFGCGQQYPRHDQTCPWSDYNIPFVPSESDNDVADAQQLNINLRRLRTTEPSVAYTDFNVRRMSFSQQQTPCTVSRIYHLASAGFYAGKFHKAYCHTTTCFFFFSRFMRHIFMKASICDRKVLLMCFC